MIKEPSEGLTFVDVVAWYPLTASISVGNIARYIVEIRSQAIVNRAWWLSVENRTLHKGLMALILVVESDKAPNSSYGNAVFSDTLIRDFIKAL
jgi:hypothetical protein